MRIIKIILYCVLLITSVISLADDYSLSSPQISDLSPKSEMVNQYNWRSAVANVESPGGLVELPVPHITKRKGMTLTLKEAILLSLRNNPNVQSQELTRITDKYALILVHHGFEPQYMLSGTARIIKGQRPVYSSTAGVNLKTTLGTQLAMSYNNTYTDSSIGGGGPGQTNLTVTQPLLQGFGRELNLIPWKNAIDAENQARLSFKNNIIDQVVAVITAYRQLIQDYQNIEIQKRMLVNNQITAQQSQLKVKVGQLAESDLLQQQVTAETTRLSLLSQQSSLISDYQGFLAALGLKANAKVKVVKKIDGSHIKVPSLKKCIAMALKGNIAYQTALLAIHATERAVTTAKDADRWRLDLAGSLNIFGTTIQPNFQVINGVTQVQLGNVNLGSPNLTLTLNIPINNVSAQVGIIDAAVKLQQAKLAIDAARLQLVRKITNEWQQIQNQILTVRAAEHQVKFQRKNLTAAQIKYKYGRTTTFEMNQIQDQLLTQETTLVSDKIALLNLITTLNQDLGITLDQWEIELRY